MLLVSMMMWHLLPFAALPDKSAVRRYDKLSSNHVRRYRED
jgi:hypothetical protein